MHRLPCIFNDLQAYIVGPHESVGRSHLRTVSGVHNLGDIQKVMPTFANPLASDPVRVWAQMSVTAPFYAGVAYSLGALSSQHALLSKLFKFEQHEEPTASS